MANLSRRSLSASLTKGVVILILGSLLLVAFSFVYPGKGGFDALNLLSLGAGATGIFIALLWYWIKTREYMRVESLELELRHQGFAEFYQQWQERLDSIE
jgi:hypothetical protein